VVQTAYLPTAIPTRDGRSRWIIIRPFSVVFKQETGLTPLEWLTKIRIEEAATQLLNTRASVTNIASALGFSSSQYFSMVFKKHKGCTPQQWRTRRW
jgi:two-component system response regulator YesN